MKYLIILFIFFKSFLVFSQTEIKTGDQFFYQKNYTKAIEQYEKVEKNYLPSIYNNYFISLIETSDLKKANIIVNKQIQKFPKNPIYKIDKGYIYLIQGNQKKAYNVFNKIVSEIELYNSNTIINISNKFSKINENKLAVKCLEKASDIYSENRFEFQIANIYMRNGETEKMITTYISLIKKDPYYKQHVLNTFQNVFGKDGSEVNVKYEILKKELIKELQISNNKDLLDMIIWVYIQQYDFNNAFKYAKIADKKYTGYEEKIFEIGSILQENKEYEIAIECHNYISKKYPKYKLSSEIEIIKIMREKCEIDNCVNQDLKMLDSKYKNIISQYGVSNDTKPLLKNYAQFLAFNYNNPDTAIFILEELDKISSNLNFKAECKLNLADILLKNNKIWEAIALYSKIEKEFANETLGHFAKFSKAKAYFYLGNIEWAKSHLDILKLSTSKLIANDAMKISLLISDNSNLDTSYDAIIMYAKAEYNFIQKKYFNSISILDSILKIFPQHSLTDEIYLLKSNIYLAEKKYNLAVKELDKIINYHYYDILSDEALFMYADLLNKEFQDIEGAMELYNKIIVDFPNSIYAQKSRTKYRTLRGDDNL